MDLLARRLRLFTAIAAVALFGWSSQLFAEDAKLDSGDTAWMLTATALVLFMTIPGLSLFYGGLVRTKNVLSVLMQCFTCTALIAVLWAIYGYSLAFTDGGGMNAYIGGFEKLFLKGLTKDSLVETFPESVFITFQMTFAIITPALVAGAFAERMKFTATLAFMVLWFTFAYLPLCHMVWSGEGALMADMGVLDFAGGTVVHINAGIAALLACILVGKRKGYPNTPMPPHNLTMTVTGAGMLWVGWFGFNAGSAVAANGDAGMAMLTTQLSTAAATLGWVIVEWMKNGKPSVLGAVTGAVAGLVAITPACGTAGPMGALVIGFISGVVCFVSATSIKRAFGYDDSLDAFGVHGIGGIVGSILTGMFAAEAFGGFGGVEAIPQLWIQTKGTVISIVFTFVVSLIILKAIDLTIGLRVTEAQEEEGLDMALHNERGYHH